MCQRCAFVKWVCWEYKRMTTRDFCSKWRHAWPWVTSAWGGGMPRPRVNLRGEHRRWANTTETFLYNNQCKGMSLVLANNAACFERSISHVKVQVWRAKTPIGPSVGPFLTNPTDWWLFGIKSQWQSNNNIRLCFSFDVFECLETGCCTHQSTYFMKVPYCLKRTCHTKALM